MASSSALLSLASAALVLEEESAVLELCVRGMYEACPRGLAFGVTSHGRRSEVMGAVRMMHAGQLLAPTLPQLAHVRTPAYDLGNVPDAQRNRWVEPLREGIATAEGFKASTLYPSIARFGVLEFGRVAVCASARQVAFVGHAIPDGTSFSDAERAALREVAAAVVVPLRVAALVADELRDRTALDRLFETAGDALVATDARGEILRSSPRAVDLLRADRELPRRIAGAIADARAARTRRATADGIHVSSHEEGDVAHLVALDGRGFVEAPAVLSSRQTQLVTLVEKGLSNAEIAIAMTLAPSTVKTMLERLYRRVGVANRTELASWRERGRLPPGERLLDDRRTSGHLPRLRMSPEEKPRAVVVGVQLPDVSDADFASSLAELERLGSTLGLRTIARVTQKRSHLAAGAVIGGGKLAELAALTGGTGVVPSGATRKKRKIDVDEPDDDLEDAAIEAEDESDEPVDAFTAAKAPPAEQASVVIVDHDLSPSQARNLERATGAEVLDRTSVILSIFQRHARTREARLQVEIARLAYLAPRLREAGAGGDRQRGGIGGKGAGESAVELDRRRIRDRIAELRHEVESIQRDAGFRRSRRAEERTVALVGYTNAGKSSWMRALTSGDVYVADKLFATLDTTVRALQPEVRPRILVSDTVGFIKKLPHDLVASFRSTLEEAREAHLLVHVVDASDPAFRMQYDVTRQVLGEVGADAPGMLLLNKIDRVPDDERAALALEFPDALLVSAKSADDLRRVHAAFVAWFERGTEEVELFVPWAKQAVVHAIHESGRVVSELHEDDGTRIVVRATSEAVARLRKRLDEAPAR